jgi:glycosyltransferase involved in cell wall biosynthesis
MSCRITLLAGLLDSAAGSHVYNRELAARLVRRGFKVDVICFNRGQLAESIPVQECPLPQWSDRRMWWRFASALNLRHAHRWVRHARLGQPDVVVGSEHLFIKGYREALPSVPMIYLPHALVMREEIESYHMRWSQQTASVMTYVRLQRWALDNAELTMRFTKLACEALTERYGLVRTKFIVNPMGVDVPRVPAFNSHPEPRLLWVGRLIKSKRIALALESLATVQDLPWTFDIVGDGDQRDALVHLTASLGLGSRVRFHGFQPDPAKFYASADLMVFPSSLENSSVSMLEAMSHGVPCLAMREDGVQYYSANSELIESGVNGFLARSDEDFSRLSRVLLSDIDAVHRAGLAARDAVRSKHTWDAHIDRFERLVGDVVQRRTALTAASLLT